MTDMKFDGGKPMMHLLTEGMPDALLAVGEVLTFGAQKYEAHSWQGLADAEARYRAAQFRHSLQQGTDEESGLLHLAHEACNVLFLLQLELNKQKGDES